MSDKIHFNMNGSLLIWIIYKQNVDEMMIFEEAYFDEEMAKKRTKQLNDENEYYPYLRYYLCKTLLMDAEMFFTAHYQSLFRYGGK